MNAPAAILADPWTDQRARHGLNTLVRVIDLEAARQEFVLLNPKNADDLRDLALDGETVILPAAERTAAQIAAIVAEYDERYRAAPHNNQTRISALDREPRLQP